MNYIYLQVLDFEQRNNGLGEESRSFLRIVFEEGNKEVSKIRERNW